MWRRAVKVGGAAALAATGIGPLLARWSGQAKRPLILGYHRIVPQYRPHPDTVLVPMQIDVAMLEAQLDWVGRRYRFVSLDELTELADQGRGQGLAAVTVDDGYRDAYDVAFPFFRRKGIPAAFFVVTDLVGSRDVPLFDRLYFQLGRAYADYGRPPEPMRAALAGAVPPSAYDALQRLLVAHTRAELRRTVDAVEHQHPMPEEIAAPLRSVDWAMVRQMADGGMTIGSHTRNHVFLTREPESVVSDELVGSKQAIEQQLGRPVRHFAYPSGQFDASSVRAVGTSGYSYAYSICDHVDPVSPALTIPRRILWQETCAGDDGRFSADLMSANMNGIFEAVRPRCRSEHRA